MSRLAGNCPGTSRYLEGHATIWAIVSSQEQACRKEDAKVHIFGQNEANVVRHMILTTTPSRSPSCPPALHKSWRRRPHSTDTSATPFTSGDVEENSSFLVQTPG
jgi:hypothetical protein